MIIKKLQKYLPSQTGVLGMNGRNLGLIYPENPRRFFPNVDDKLRCKQLLADRHIPTPKTYYIIDGTYSLRGWADHLADYDSFVIKPNRSFGGRGILLIESEDGHFVSSGEPLDSADITFHIRQILSGAFTLESVDDTAYFEQTVRNHPDLQLFLSDGSEGVADVRIIYLGSRPVMAMLRVPTMESGGRANLHQGGLGIGIDLKTGLTKNGCHRDRIITHHPETGELLRERRIPDFSLMLDYGREISNIVQLGYIGVDFVCDKDWGPLVLEVNARPGLSIQIANCAGLERALR